MGEELSGEPTPSVETPEVGFFDPAELPPLSLDRVMPIQIETSLQTARDGGPAYFD